jgi:hypothetical protein
MWLPNSLIEAVKDADIKVFYVSFAATRLWAKGRDADEPIVFSGWYYARGPVEAGPFRSMSAAYRDAWYRMVERIAPPAVAERNETYEKQRNVETNKARRKRAGTRTGAEARP